jgi:putative phage-type endonuclease
MNELIDITDAIIVEEEPPFLNDTECLELFDTCLFLMEELIRNNPTLISEPEFNEIFDENVDELIHSHFDDDVFYTEDAEDDVNEVILSAKDEFFKEFIPPRSYPDSIIIWEPDYDYVKEQIIVLKNKPQPVQRTKEWYHFRHNLITASNAYKAFESQANKNQLIYEKCQPLNSDNFENNSDDETHDTDEDDDIKTINIKIPNTNIIPQQKIVNVNSTLHWGQKYEPLSVEIYEYVYKTKVDDFGCIQHETHKFIGASPDGINVDPKSLRYGRMLEIKNIVNREINGIPKKEYWIQMQLQMEVCDLDECDFLETKFTEYEDYNSYLEDSYNETDEPVNLTISKDGKMKGVIIYFNTKEGSPKYIYKPLDIINSTKITEWEDATVTLYQSEKYNYTFMKFLYWKQERNSCVLVARNRQWFKDNVSGIAALWSIIETERVTGWEHRAPNRKQKKDIDNENVLDLSLNEKSGCLLQFNKDTGKITVTKS